jgi:isopentenyl phosphate kinase
MASSLQFLKLGGSLITNKEQPFTPRLDILAQAAQEIALWLKGHPEARLVLGHGSGSFGHGPAKKYGTRGGVHSEADWKGFAEVWRAAAALNRLMMDALAAADVPAVAFPPSACVKAADGKVYAWDLTPIQAALAAGLLPVVYGDVVFDQVRGGTILSTEDLFAHLAVALRPRRILLAGHEPGVWADFPACTHFLQSLTPWEFEQLGANVGEADVPDVTGGMATKVAAGLAMVQAVPDMDAYIFSGEESGAVGVALSSGPSGTRLRCDPPDGR